MTTEKQSSASSLTNDPAAFAAWAKLSNPIGMTENEVVSYLSSEGVFIRPKGHTKTSRKGPLEIGEVVKIRGDKCTHPQNKKNCEALNFTVEDPVYCVITQIHKPEDLREDCTIEVSPLDLVTGKPGNKFSFKAVLPKRGTKKLETDLTKAENKGDIEKQRDVLKKIRDKCLSPHDKVGIYRAFKNISSYLKATATKPIFAIVYDGEGKSPTPQARRDLTKSMLEERKKKTHLHGNFDELMDTELSKFSTIYYEGEIISAGYTKTNDFYFVINERDGREFTSINPSKGKVYFVSSSQDMPAENDWVEEFKGRVNEIINTSVK